MRNLRILPILHGSKVNLREKPTRKIQLRIVGQAIDRHDSDHYGGDRQGNLRIAHLFVGQQDFAAAEVDCPAFDLSNTFGGSEGQVSNLDVVVARVEFARPRLIQIDRHVGAGPYYHNSLLRRGCSTQPRPKHRGSETCSDGSSWELHRTSLSSVGSSGGS